jgi:predicted lactoylglutathione lyase
LGFSRRVSVEGWLQFEAANGAATEFFGITESPGHTPNENRVAFWAESAAEVDRVAEVAARVGARNIEGPMNYEPGYYAVFFEDPCGNRLEVCHRWRT